MLDLHQAVVSGNQILVYSIVKLKPTVVNNWDLSFNTPLHLVYKNVDEENPTIADDRLSIMQILLEHGAYVNAVNLNNETPLHEAVRKSQFNGVKMLLENGADSNIRDRYLMTPLHIAAGLKNNSTEYVKLLLYYGKTKILNIRDGYGTVLEKSILPRVTESAMILLLSGAKVKDVYDLLLSALNDENMESVEFILQYSIQMDKHGRFLLENLIFYEKFGYYFFIKNHHETRTKIIGLLMDKNIKIIKSCENRQTTALQYAAENLNEFNVRLLLVNGANINETDRCGNTSLHYVLSNSNKNDEKIYRIAKMLINKGADVSKINCFGCRPIHLAIKNLHVNVINLILSELSGIDVVELNKNSQKCLEWLTNANNDYVKYSLDEISVAIISGFTEVVERILDKKLIFDTDMEFFKIPNHYLYYAASENQIEIVKMLIDAGYDDCRHDLIIDWKKLSIINPRIICTLWELDNNSLSKTLFLKTLRANLEKPKHNNPHLHEITKLQILYFTIKLQKNRLDKNLLAAEGIFRLHKGFLQILEDCNLILHELRQEEIGDQLNMFHIISMKPEIFVSFLKNNTLLWCCENLYSTLLCKHSPEIHELILLERIGFAIRQRKRLDYSSDNVNKPFFSI